MWRARFNDVRRAAWLVKRCGYELRFVPGHQAPEEAAVAPSGRAAPAHGRGELESTLDILSECRRLDPFSPRNIGDLAQGNFLNLLGDLLSFPELAGGAVTGTVLLVNSPHAEADVAAWRRGGGRPQLGWHPCLTLDAPVLPPRRVPSLVDRDGRFFPLARFLVRLVNHTPSNPVKIGIDLTTMERIYLEFRRGL